MILEGMEWGMGWYGVWYGRVRNVEWKGMEGYGMWIYREVVHETDGYTNLENSDGIVSGIELVGSGRIGSDLVGSGRSWSD